ncbi:perlucin-like protein isoform X2 [Ostrea edulis]|uniref:perlucin-like protein isoform X2 n=1 Tax=Ostrea edulis TaxID=37623 RepID=UPI0024AFD17A|nr:perlucin-like protein isoform X2 [Ostrea edulis]
MANGLGTAVVFTCCVLLVLGGCPLEWSEYQGECLHFSNHPRGWVDAARECRKYGAYLMTDDNEEKHNFVTQVLTVLHEFRETGFWIGADDYIFEGQWRWIETGGSVGPFSKWAAGYPSKNTTMNCLVMKFEGTDLYWTDDQCNPWTHGKERGGNHYFICEKPSSADASGMIG